MKYDIISSLFGFSSILHFEICSFNHMERKRNWHSIQSQWCVTMYGKSIIELRLASYTLKKCLPCIIYVTSQQVVWRCTHDKFINSQPHGNNMLACLLACLLHGVGYLKSWLSLSLSKNILSLWNPKVHYRVHKSPYPEPAKSSSSHRSLSPYLNVILPPTLRSPQ
jgi:hypothetical protein